MKIEIIVELTGMFAIPDADLREIVREQMFKMGEYWHKHFRLRHFHASAFQLYRYTPRSKKYQWRKLKKGLGNNPLVFKGVSRRLSEGKTIVATASKVDVIMATRAFNFKPKNSQVNMRDEFTQINDDEHKALDKRLEDGVTKKVINWKANRTTRLKS